MRTVWPHSVAGPGLPRDAQLRESLLGSGAEGRAELEVGDIGDVPAVLRAEEDVDVVVLGHGSP